MTCPTCHNSLSADCINHDRGTGAIDNGDPKTVTLSGREYERYLCGALNDQVKPSDDDIDRELMLVIPFYDPNERYPEYGVNSLREAYRAGWEDGAR